MAFKNVRVQLGSFAAAHDFQEIAKVAFALAFKGADQFAFQIEQRFAGNDSLGAIENPAAFEIRVERVGLQPARLRDDGLAAKIMNDYLSVGCLAGVRVTETSAVADDGPAQAGDAQTPAANIRRVNIVVAQLAVARVQNPVPVVMKLRPRQLIHRRGTGPQVIIHARGNFARTGSADGITPAIDNAAGQFHFAELAVVNVSDGLGQRAVGAVLRSALANATQLARHLHDPAAFADIVADRFLDINILARVHRPNRRQRVPVVRRRDEDCGDRLVIENHAQILDCLWLGTFLRDQVSGDLGGAIAIRIADVSDLTIRKPGELARVLFAANAATDDGHCDFVVGAYGA